MKHRVFISHSVQDTGNTFTSHLVSALYNDGIDAISSNDASDDDVISETLLSNISDSLISVVVISESYGASPRCLEELVTIIECMEKNGQRVLPVFHGVEPTHVRNQVGDFGIGFWKLVQSKEFMDRVPAWRSALIATANLSGQVTDDRSEAAVVDYTVELIGDIIDKLPVSDDSEDNGLVGVAQVKKVESLLNLQSTEAILLVGIWGMGGIGKTTIAQRIFERTSYQFDSACCLLNFKERFGQETLWREMFSQLLKSRDLKILLPSTVKRRLKRKRVLAIIDDVMSKYSYHLPFIDKPEKYFGPGSRIIFTSRDKQLLKSTYNCKEEHIYQVQELSSGEALELFKYHAFKQQSPTEWQKELSIEVVRYAGGLPLALVVLGCHLHDKNMEQWKSDLKKLKNIPGNYKEIEKILNISFEDLEFHQQNIFLDIACAFNDYKRSSVEEILDASGFHAVSGIGSLLDKALVTVTYYGTLEMHHLLQQLGHNIVLSKCKDDASKRSRLWSYIDFYEMMTEDKGSEKVEVISVDLCEAPRLIIDLKPGAFRNLLGLRVLQLYYRYGLHANIRLHLPDGLEFLPSKLVKLRWDYYPLASLPDNFCPSHLLELTLRHSNIEQIWSTRVKQHLPNLKSMDLSFSKHLIDLPDFSRLPNLEILYLTYCSSLEAVPESLGLLQNLKELYLSGSAIKELPLSIAFLSQLEILDLEDCFKLHSLPTGICKLECLQWLYLHGCSLLTTVPDHLGNLKFITKLDFRGCSLLESLPKSIKHFPNLKSLWVTNCKNLGCLPDLPPTLTMLEAWGCTSLSSIGNLLGGDLLLSEGFYFDLMDCVSLDGNMSIKALVDARLKFKAIAQFASRCSANLCIPGSQMPKWMKYKEDGSKLHVKLSEGRLEDFSRPVFCVVTTNGDSFFQVAYECLLVTREREYHVKGLLDEYPETRSKHEHVFLWYDNNVVFENIPLMCSEATFEFEIWAIEANPSFDEEDRSSHFNYKSRDPKILWCGITPLGGSTEIEGSLLVEARNQALKGEEYALTQERLTNREHNLVTRDLIIIHGDGNKEGSNNKWRKYQGEDGEKEWVGVTMGNDAMVVDLSLSLTTTEQFYDDSCEELFNSKRRKVDKEEENKR